MNDTQLIVMLTQNDRTVSNAREVFELCRDADIKYWGFKEEGLSRSDLISLGRYMRECGKIPVLEVVAYGESECLDGATLAVECGCEILMGTVYFEAVHRVCEENGIRYMPFVGKVEGRPSVLRGSCSEMVCLAKELADAGVFGLDLLSYRYDGDGSALTSELLSRVDIPVCVAGSVDSYKKLDDVKASHPWAFTIGSAFFDGKFGGSIKEQISTVLDYMKK